MARALQRAREAGSQQVEEAEQEAGRRVAAARERGEAAAAEFMAQGLAAARRRADEIREEGREQAQRLRRAADRHFASWVEAVLARVMPTGREEEPCSSR